ncbi:type I methionyl aminopeptidase [bacterium]|nr:type I methionyl aminopeptidase [bacterium]
MSRILAPLTPEEVILMREVCQLAARTLKYAGEFVKPGITTNEIDRLVHEYTLEHDARPATLNYHGFPKSVCTSVNEVICHGVPDETVLKEGDIINIDVTSIKNGFFGDTSATFYVGEVSEEAMRLTECARDAMWKGIEQVSPFGTTGDIGFAVNKFVTRKGFSVVKEIGGHGIGKAFHGDPFVPSHGKRGRGDKLIPWTCLTVEPMVNVTTSPIEEFDIPGSSHKYYMTEDRCLSAQFEHTILITDEGYEVLTFLEN